MKIDAGHPLRPPSHQALKAPRKADFERQLKAAKAAQSAAEKGARPRADQLRSEQGGADQHGLAESFEDRASRRAFTFAELGVLEAGRAFEAPDANAARAGRSSAAALSAEASAGEPSLAIERAQVGPASSPLLEVLAPRAARSAAPDAAVSEPAVLVDAAAFAAAVEGEPPAGFEIDLDVEAVRAEGPDGSPGGETSLVQDGPSLTVHAEGGLAQLIVRAADPGDRESLHRRLRAVLAEHGLGLGDLVLNGGSTAPSGARHGHRPD